MRKTRAGTLSSLSALSFEVLRAVSGHTSSSTTPVRALQDLYRDSPCFDRLPCTDIVFKMSLSLAVLSAYVATLL